MININVRSDLRALTASLTSLALQQIPFATAQALNKVAARVKAAEQENIRATFKKPTPFTQNSVSTTRATKNHQVATVFVRPVAARYLLPYEVGGNHVLNSRALLNPKDIRLNQYGQLPKTTLAALRARPDVFIGKVKTKKGIVDGVWQRVTGTGRPAPVNAKGRKLRGLNKTEHLKLLIRFGDAIPVNKQLNYGAKAKQIINLHLAADFNDAMSEAIRTAR